MYNHVIPVFESENREGRSMKTILIVLLTMFIVTSIGCGGSGQQPSPDSIETLAQDVPVEGLDEPEGGEDLVVPDGVGTLRVLLSDPAGEVDSCFGPFSFATIHDSTDVLLATAQVKTFRLRVYASTPESGGEEPLFDSLAVHGCFKAGGATIKIQELPSGVGRYALWEGFSDNLCEDLHVAGVRWGVTIMPNQTTEVHLYACSVE